MRPVIGAVIAVLLGSALAPAGAAEFSPVFVIPGKPGVPVIINGWDASFTVVEGEFGLDRPGQVNPVIVGNPMIAPAPLQQGSYYPRAGRRPGYGRLEIEPPANRRLPRPAQSYHRSWSAESDPLPASLDPPVVAPDVSVNVNRDDEDDARRDNLGRDDGDLRRDDRDLRRRDRDRRRDDRDLRRGERDMRRDDRDLRRGERDLRRDDRDLRRHDRDASRRRIQGRNHGGGHYR